MSKMFGNLKTDGLEDTGDVLGGGGPVDSGAYPAKIKLAYLGQSQNGAQSVTVLADIGSREYRETIYYTKRTGENFYVKDGKEYPLPGFTTINDLCLLATGHPLVEQEDSIEDKVVKIYDFDAKKELPQNVKVITSLLGTEVILGIVRQTVDKNVKGGNGDYVPSGETRDENVIEKVFHAESKRTVTEFKEGFEEPIHYPKWVEKNTGNTRNKAKGVQGKTSAPGRPAAAAASGAPAAAPKKKSSLFG